MEFDFSLQKLFKITSPTFIILTRDNFRNYTPITQLSTVLDKLSAASQLSQKIPNPLTSLSHILEKDQHVLLYITPAAILGYAKLGVKHLFQLSGGEFHEILAFCLLDFYVCQQRQGVGLIIMSKIESVYGIDRREIAVDRPSEKMRGFGKKYLGWKGICEQNSEFLQGDSGVKRLAKRFERARFEAKRRGAEIDVFMGLEGFLGVVDGQKVVDFVSEGVESGNVCGMEKVEVEEEVSKAVSSENVEECTGQVNARHVKTGFW